MSCEISEAPKPKQTVEVQVTTTIPENQAQILTFPGVPIDEKIVEPPIKSAKKPKTVEQENQGPSEPIYEPPANDVILAQ